jgi:hypothetical protein
MPWTSWDYLFGRGGEPPTADERAGTKFRDRTVLFGDAAGALVLRLEEGDRGVLGFKLYYRRRILPRSVRARRRVRAAAVRH